jgi:hypothetical protein
VRPRDRQQLEERGRSEQIEIVRVQVPVVLESLARFSRADPAIVEPGQAAFVELDRPCGAVARPDGDVVPLDQDNERCEGERDPPVGQRASRREHAERHRAAERDESQLAETKILTIETFEHRPARLGAGAILVGGRERHASYSDSATPRSSTGQHRRHSGSSGEGGVEKLHQRRRGPEGGQ